MTEKVIEEENPYLPPVIEKNESIEINIFDIPGETPKNLKI